MGARDPIEVGFANLERLGRALFEAQERMLPEGEVWDELDEADRDYWAESAGAVIHELRALLSERPAPDL